MQHLNLAQNVIPAIPINFLDQFIKLRSFNISYNLITNIPTHWATTADTDLEILDLRGNHIKRLMPDAFTMLSKLKKLDLAKNGIVTIHANAFQGLAKLYKLLLENNQLLHIESNTFAPLTKMERLYLAHNQLQTVSKKWFGNETMPKLKNIYLKMNHIFEIEKKAFQYTPNLEYFSVSFNTLVTLDSELFKDLRKMKQLYASYNRIEMLSGRIFEYMPILQKFHINGNRLTYLPIFNDQWWQLVEFNLDANPWQCPCLKEIEGVLSRRMIFFGNSIASSHYTGIKPVCVITATCEKTTSQMSLVTMFENATNRPRTFSDFIVSK